MNLFKVYVEQHDRVIVYTVQALSSENALEAMKSIPGSPRPFRVEMLPSEVPDNIIKVDFVNRKRIA